MMRTEIDPAAARAQLLTAAADPVRWRLLATLGEGPRCVCDLQPVAAVAPNVLSYHLKVLRDAKLVEGTKRGRWVDYRLADDAGLRLAAALPIPARSPEFAAAAGRASRPVC